MKFLSFEDLLTEFINHCHCWVPFDDQTETEELL
jgi:hypothetical protein